MIDPVAFHIGPLAVRWYGISYAVGLTVAIAILDWMNRRQKLLKNTNQIFDLAFWVFLVGVIVGGRLGYVLIYNLPYYLESPAKIIAVWEGGMSFHGGLIGSIIVAFFFCRKHKIRLLDLADLAVVPAALSTSFGRIANFINRELVGRPVENPNWNWLGVDFGDGVLRYPSQLFQSAGDVLLFFILLMIFLRKPQKGTLLFGYLALNGLFRSILENWRAPDPQIGFLFGYFTLGQLLSLGMMVAGLIGLIFLTRRNRRSRRN